MQKLYLVGTPIGNLGDMTYRAVEILNSVDFIACENINNSKILLQKYGIFTKTISLNSANEEFESKKILSLLQSGKSIAIITDAGMPVLSDPGAELVRLAHENNITINVIPGASALTTAICGLGINKFTFLGFITNKDLKRKNILSELAGNNTYIFYESTHRIKEFVEDIAEIFGNTQKIGIARELTKIYEECFWTTAEEYLDKLTNEPPRGEFVLCLPLAATTEDEDLAELEELLQAFKSASTKDISHLLKKKFNLSKQTIYKMVSNLIKN